MRVIATAAAVLGLAALPAAADGASYYNDSPTKGAYVVRNSRNIDVLQVFCAGSGGNENRELRFDVAGRIVVGSKHKFSYSGTVYPYGPEGEPRDPLSGKLSGHLNGSKSISIKWKLPGCGTGTSVAAVQG